MMTNTEDWYECRLDTCKNLFQKKVHNQSFCGRECCRIYTNARILAQYHQRKNRVMTGRVCSSCRVTVLSRYNPENECASCEAKAHKKKLEDWGWVVEDE